MSVRRFLDVSAGEGLGLVGLAVEGVFAFLAAIIFLPARVLRGRRHVRLY